MDLLTALRILNYGLILIYGLFLSTYISGGWETRRQKWLVFALCPLLLLTQSLFWLWGGITAARQFYPLIVHLPLVLLLIFALKKQVGVALVSVCTAYLCCQLPRWVNLAVSLLMNSPLAGEISYTLVIVPIYLLLRRYFVKASRDAMIYSPQTVFLFGSLPFLYYIFDYTTAIYSDVLYGGIPALTEFFPTALAIFYVVFLAAYHSQSQKRTQSELRQSMLKAELKQAGAELESLRRAESQTAIYQHDMRHHLSAIDGFLATDNPQRAREYIRTIQADMEAITPKRFCQNQLVNMLCSSFSGKAAHGGIRLTVDAHVPEDLRISDVELCSVLSNGLENAFRAVSALDPSQKWVDLYCDMRIGKFLIEIKNPYAGEIPMEDGLPVPAQVGGPHGYGCRSILSIAERNQGLCTFEAEQGVFTLRVALPQKA